MLLARKIIKWILIVFVVILLGNAFAFWAQIQWFYYSSEVMGEWSAQHSAIRNYRLTPPCRKQVHPQGPAYARPVSAWDVLLRPAELVFRKDKLSDSCQAELRAVYPAYRESGTELIVTLEK